MKTLSLSLVTISACDPHGDDGSGAVAQGTVGHWPGEDDDAGGIDSDAGACGVEFFLEDVAYTVSYEDDGVIAKLVGIGADRVPVFTLSLHGYESGTRSSKPPFRTGSGPCEPMTMAPSSTSVLFRGKPTRPVCGRRTGLRCSGSLRRHHPRRKDGFRALDRCSRPLQPARERRSVRPRLRARARPSPGPRAPVQRSTSCATAVRGQTL